jgi:hypothetical protein
VSMTAGYRSTWRTLRTSPQDLVKAWTSFRKRDFRPSKNEGIYQLRAMVIWDVSICVPSSEGRTVSVSDTEVRCGDGNTGRMCFQNLPRSRVHAGLVFHSSGMDLNG